jgi:hypothetical protein
MEAPRLVSDQRDYETKLNFRNNVSAFQNYLLHPDKILQMNNNNSSPVVRLHPNLAQASRLCLQPNSHILVRGEKNQGQRKKPHKNPYSNSYFIAARRR